MTQGIQGMLKFHLQIFSILSNLKKNYALQCRCLNCTLPEVKFCVKNEKNEKIEKIEKNDQNDQNDQMTKMTKMIMMTKMLNMYNMYFLVWISWPV